MRLHRRLLSRRRRRGPVAHAHGHVIRPSIPHRRVQPIKQHFRVLIFDTDARDVRTIRQHIVRSDVVRRSPPGFARVIRFLRRQLSQLFTHHRDRPQPSVRRLRLSHRFLSAELRLRSRSRLRRRRLLSANRRRPSSSRPRRLPRRPRRPRRAVRRSSKHHARDRASLLHQPSALGFTALIAQILPEQRGRWVVPASPMNRECVAFSVALRARSHAVLIRGRPRDDERGLGHRRARRRARRVEE